MSNLADKRCFRSNISNKSSQMNAVKKPAPFSERNTIFEANFSANVPDRKGFAEMMPRKSNVHSQMNQLFKVPNFENLPVKKATVKSIKSPRRVQAGRVKNDLKSSQQTKMSLIPRPSFITSRKSLLNSSRSSQLNARKELIKKMVFLAECALKENKQVKQTTPVKMIVGLTPKKTPRSGGYFLLPEFQKKTQKVEDIRSPLQDLIKKEMYAYSAKQTPAPTPAKDMTKCLTPVVEPKRETSDRLTAILQHCKVYNEEVNGIHNKLKALDDSFENKLNTVPECAVHKAFCTYQSQKEAAYREMQAVEEDLKNFIGSQTQIGQKVEAYLKKKREFLENQMSLHRDFERAVNVALEKCGPRPVEKKEEDRTKVKEETPKLRRSLRLSKIRKSKFEEKTPMTRKLKKLDSKSKGILKSGKV